MKGRDVITDPKTPKSNRVVQMPSFLCDEIQDYIKTLYAVQPDDRIFQVTKSYLFREMERGCKETGVKRIKVHGLRHSHISLLIDMGFSALAIADRVGHVKALTSPIAMHLFPTEAKRNGKQVGYGTKGGRSVSLKNCDNKNRWRSKTIGFRVSPEEDEQINRYVKLSGLTKQDYITRRLTCKEVVVQGNPRVFKALRDQLAAVLNELRRIDETALMMNCWTLSNDCLYYG